MGKSIIWMGARVSNVVATVYFICLAFDKSLNGQFKDILQRKLRPQINDDSFSSEN
jgi:hypothetical protein